MYTMLLAHFTANDEPNYHSKIKPADGIKAVSIGPADIRPQY